MTSFYITKIALNLLCILLQAFLILEIERCWLILKGKKSRTADNLLQFIQQPFSTVIKDKRTLKFTSMIIFPLLFGLMCAGGIPFLNYFIGTRIALGYPWGYVAMFGAGYVGISIFILIACLHTRLSYSNLSLEKISYFLMCYIVLLLSSFYFQFKIFIL